MSEKKYVSLSKLSTFLDNLKNTFSGLGHKHTLGDLTDYTVDTELSSTSTNPVANSTLDAEFEAVATGMAALETAIEDKLEKSKLFIDTYANYQTAYANGEIPNGTLVIIIDDSVDTSTSTYTSSLLGTGVLGYMILG